jgi:hypothetical protein
MIYTSCQHGSSYCYAHLMNSTKFILFAHPRSGSTTLAHVLNRHPALRILIEPFLEDPPPGHPEHLEPIVDAASLDARLSHIFETYNGIKTICWPLADELYAHMLSQEQYRVIFLRRKNILKASVSCAISRRIGVWAKPELPQNPGPLYAALGEIPLSEIVEWIDAVQEAMDRYEAILDSRPPHMVMKVIYEDLYEATPMQKQTIRSVFSFLGLRPIPWEQMQDLFDRGENQMNSVETYRLVPNYREVDEIGSQKGYGSLFTGFDNRDYQERPQQAFL